MITATKLKEELDHAVKAMAEAMSILHERLGRVEKWMIQQEKDKENEGNKSL